MRRTLRRFAWRLTATVMADRAHRYQARPEGGHGLAHFNREFLVPSGDPVPCGRVAAMCCPAARATSRCLRATLAPAPSRSRAIVEARVEKTPRMGLPSPAHA